MNQRIRTTVKRSFFMAVLIFVGMGMQNLNAKDLTTPDLNDPAQLASQIRMYIKTNVKPELEPLRNDFDQQLSAEEKKEIEAIRNEFKEVAKQRKAAGLDRNMRKNLASDLSDEQIAVMKSTRQRAYAAFSRAILIGENHQAQLDEIFGKQEKNFDQWRNDIEQMVADQIGNRLFVLKPLVKQNLKRLAPGEDLVCVFFVCWDPTNPIEY